MKEIKKILSVIICCVLIFTCLPITSIFASETEDVKFYYTVNNGKATVTGIDNVTSGKISLTDKLGGYPVTAIGNNAFENCEDITDFTIPEGVVSIGNSAFSGCHNLRKINLPESIEAIGEKAFYECTALESLILPKKLTVISKQSFANCYSLETVRLSYGITTISEQAFLSCYNLTIFIPKSVTIIGSGAFLSCYNLTIYYCADKQDWTSIQIGNNNTSLESAEFYYHKYQSTYMSPTCSKLGSTVYTCSICNHNYSVIDTSSEFSSHDYEDEFTIDVNADDFKDGSKSRHCKNCDAYTDVTVIPRTSKAYGNYSDTIEWVIKNNGTLVLLGKGAISDYKLPVYTPWYEYSEFITALEISKQITRLGNNSFSSLENLTDAVINSPDTEFGISVFAIPSDLKIKCFYGSFAEQYAKNNGHCFTFFSAPEAPVIQSIEKTTATLVIADGYEYSTDGTNWQKSNIFTIPQNQIISFYQRLAETELSAASPPSDAVKGISVSAPQIVLVGESQIYIKPCENFEYGIENVLWQSENSFTKWIIPNETYTVYQRYKETEGVFAVYDTEGTTVTVNGNNKPQKANSEYLIWLKKHLFENEQSNNIAADINDDFCIDILDLVALKIKLLKS